MFAMSTHEVDAITSIKDVLQRERGDTVEVIGIVDAVLQEVETTPHSSRYVGVLRIWVDDGPVLVRFNNPQATFASGVLEYIAGKQPTRGDMICVQASVIDNVYALLDAGDNEAYMSVPSEERFDDYLTERSLVRDIYDELVAHVEAKRYREARETFAELRKYELIVEENEQIQAEIQLVPPWERPVHLDAPADAALVEYIYGLNPETMNLEQFLLFAHCVFDGFVMPVEAGIDDCPSAVALFVQYPDILDSEARELFTKYITQHEASRLHRPR